jgi:hypothetical protein
VPRVLLRELETLAGEKRSLESSFVLKRDKARQVAPVWQQHPCRLPTRLPLVDCAFAGVDFPIGIDAVEDG